MRESTAVNPPGTGTFGLALFLASLTMLFIAGIAGYAIIRITGRNSPQHGVIQLPLMLWISTLLVTVSSVTIQNALVALRREKTAAFRQSLTLTFMLALGFVAIQSPALWNLLQQHARYQADNVHLYGLIFMLILLHALHVVGGLIPMTITWFRARAGRYDHENVTPILHLTMYWHFLDIVWVVMFCAFLVLA